MIIIGLAVLAIVAGIYQDNLGAVLGFSTALLLLIDR